MKINFDLRCSCRAMSGRRRLLAIALATVGIGVLANANMVRAQAPGPKVAANVALKVGSRAEKFMRDIAALSPMPPNTDPVHAQAWPRPLDAGLSAEDSSEPNKIEVTGNITSENIGNGPTWDISLQGRVGISLWINANGAVASFRDTPLMRTLDSEPPLEEEQFIAPETAVARALKYMGAMGLNPNEYALERVHYFNRIVPSSAGSQAWYIEFACVWQGVPYMRHRVSFELDAGQGRLLTCGGENLAALPPLTARLDVSIEQALSIARRFIAQRVPEITGDADIELRVVLPSHFWTSGGMDETPTTAQSRLAWRIRQPVTMARDISRTLEVWVDTLTGEILGGDNIGLRGPGKIGILGGAIGRALRSAHHLQAVALPSPPAQTADKQNGSHVLSLALATNKLRFYGLIAGMTGPILPAGNQKPLASDSKFKPTHRLTATLADGRTTAYLYDAATGRITTEDGAAGDIVQAGAGLRAWLSPAPLASSAIKSKQGEAKSKLSAH